MGSSCAAKGIGRRGRRRAIFFSGRWFAACARPSTGWRCPRPARSISGVIRFRHAVEQPPGLLVVGRLCDAQIGDAARQVDRPAVPASPASRRGRAGHGRNRAGRIRRRADTTGVPRHRPPATPSPVASITARLIIPLTTARVGGARHPAIALPPHWRSCRRPGGASCRTPNRWPARPTPWAMCRRGFAYERRRARKVARKAVAAISVRGRERQVRADRAFRGRFQQQPAAQRLVARPAAAVEAAARHRHSWPRRRRLPSRCAASAAPRSGSVRYSTSSARYRGRAARRGRRLPPAAGARRSPAQGSASAQAPGLPGAQWPI